MKKMIPCILLLALLLMLVACGADSTSDSGSAPGASSEAVDTGTHLVYLVNAKVDGADKLEITQEGSFLARAVLPDRDTAVDYWTIDGVKVDAGDRRYTLEFQSEGVSVVSAVLRERLNVNCEGCFIQFLDDNGTPSGPLYQKVYFEDDYVIPPTGVEHPGGTIDCYIGAKLPAGKTVDYWVINGTAVRFDGVVTGFCLYGLDKPLDIQVVLTDGQLTHGHDLLVTFDPNPNIPPHYPDDNPFGVEDDDGGYGWEDDWIVDDSDFDNNDGDPQPGGNTNGHEHNWVYDGEHSWLATCTQDGRNAFKCTGCGETYYQTVPGGHHYQWVCMDWDNHQQVCSVCGASGATERHNFVYEGNGKWRCTVCGYTWYEIN
jgi:hypothetical protein